MPRRLKSRFKKQSIDMGLNNEYTHRQIRSNDDVIVTLDSPEGELMANIYLLGVRRREQHDMLNDKVDEISLNDHLLTTYVNEIDPYSL